MESWYVLLTSVCLLIGCLTAPAAATSPSVGVPAQPPARDSIWGSSPSVRRSLTDIIHADQTLEA